MSHVWCSGEVLKKLDRFMVSCKLQLQHYKRWPMSDQEKWCEFRGHMARTKDMVRCNRVLVFVNGVPLYQYPVTTYHCLAIASSAWQCTSHASSLFSLPRHHCCQSCFQGWKRTGCLAAKKNYTKTPLVKGTKMRQAKLQLHGIFFSFFFLFDITVTQHDIVFFWKAAWHC
jgi:hypothetical protein